MTVMKRRPSLRIRILASTLLAALGLSLAGADQAQACSCYYPPEYSYQDHVDAAQEVVVGQVLFSFRLGDQRFTAFRPEVDAKGCLASQEKTLWIQTEASEAMCGVELERRERYLLHLNGKGDRNTYPLGLCTFHKKMHELSEEEMNHLFAQSPQCETNMPAREESS